MVVCEIVNSSYGQGCDWLRLPVAVLQAMVGEGDGMSVCGERP